MKELLAIKCLVILIFGIMRTKSILFVNLVSIWRISKKILRIKNNIVLIKWPINRKLLIYLGTL
jgi:hypothetical protein